MKLIRDEPESDSLRTFLDAADLLSSELALTEVPRAIRRAAAADPTLRPLDAIHVASAIDAAPLDAFISYDIRQSAAARLAGLRTIAPGVAAP